MPQEFRKIRGRTLEEAYRKMRQQFGDDALVVSTLQVTEGGLFGLFGERLIEITASVPQPMHAADLRPATPMERAYTQQDARRQGSMQYFEQVVRDAQRRMNVAPPNPAAPEPPRAAQQTREPARPVQQDFHAPNTNVAPVVPFPQRKNDPQQVAETLNREVQEIREMMQVLYAESPGAGLPTEFAPHYRTLVDRGVSRKVAAALIASVIKGSDLGVIRDPRVFVERLNLEIRKLVVTTGGIQLLPGQRRLVALCGPTGVGKTTNIAKLAAHFAVRERVRVGLITTDTYRVAAPEQLRVYSNIIGIPLKVANNTKELREALQELSEYDLVLMDTAGGSQFNLEQIRELQGILQFSKPDEIILAMSASTQLHDLRSAVTNFRCVGPTSVMFSKLDESSQFGGLFSMVMEAGVQLSYFSVGQNVPDDIRVATPAFVAKLILEGRDSRG